MMRLCFLVLWVSVVGSSGVDAAENDNLDVVQMALDDAMRPASQYYYYDYQMWMTNLSFSVTNMDYHKVMKDGALHFGVLWKIKNTIAEQLGVAFENVSVFLYPGNVAVNVLAVVEAPESQKLKVKATPNNLGTLITTAVQGIANIASATPDHNANDIGIGLYASRHDDPQPIVTPAPTATLEATKSSAVTDGKADWNIAATTDPGPGGAVYFQFSQDGSIGPGSFAKFIACPAGGCATATCPTLLTAENAIPIIGTSDVTPCDPTTAHGVAAAPVCKTVIYSAVKTGFSTTELGGLTKDTETVASITATSLTLCIQALGKSPTRQTAGIPACAPPPGAAAAVKKDLAAICR
jgi:hypothetical protein